MILENKKIYAKYNNTTIRVYQAFNHEIANEALELNTFGDYFKKDRMTWIKPSFLWMMYRSGWGTKKNQERILAIDIYRTFFNELLSKAVLTSFDNNVYASYDEWKSQLSKSNVRCQFDPDRDIYGNPLDKRAIQLGIKGDMVEKYLTKGIYNIIDMTNKVKEYREQINNDLFDIALLPVEIEYSSEIK
ncbi:DUF4291 domain-containing protein [Vallitalea guaymasensis]|uniref:DUF4291 domain-containing protein n=1 Tax=Vallitalea guaymasensis TaxID=1185412 RepID=UPI00272C009E|nr:DUF4291 domain-containing protein [Vallitalea guaymasensis]